MNRSQTSWICWLAFASVATLLAASEATACSVASDPCVRACSCCPESDTPESLSLDDPGRHPAGHMNVPHPDHCCSLLPCGPCPCAVPDNPQAEYRTQNRRILIDLDGVLPILRVEAVDPHPLPQRRDQGPSLSDNASSLRFPLYLRTSRLLF